MDTSNLLTKFARIGARLKVSDRPSRSLRIARDNGTTRPIDASRTSATCSASP